MTDPQHEETFADTERKLREIITTLRAQLAEARAERDVWEIDAKRNHQAAEIEFARAEQAEAALAAQIEVDAGLCSQHEMAIPMDRAKRTLGGLYCADVWCGEGKHAGHGYADLIRNQPRAGAAEHGSYDRTALDRLRGKGPRKGAAGGGTGLRLG